MEELRPGAYGCVYRPAFRCKEPPVYPDEKYISKVMRKKTAKKELDLLNGIRDFKSMIS